MDRIIRLANYRIKILKWRDQMKKYGLTNEYFASSGFSPHVLPFNFIKGKMPPYPKIETRAIRFDRELNLLQVNRLLHKKQVSLNKKL